MGLEENVKKIVEDRQAAAVKKDLTRKFKAVANVLGFDIRHGGGGSDRMEGGLGHSASPALEFGWEWELEDDEEESLPISEDVPTYVIGKYFDGLSSGINLQILYREDEETTKVTYNGILIYHEFEGNLHTYLPSDLWESKLEMLFRLAKKQAKIQDEKVQEDRAEDTKGRVRRILDYLRTNWGV